MRGYPGRLFLNGKWLAQTPSGTQRYATEVVRSISGTELAARITLVVPRDAVLPPWAGLFPVLRSRTRGLFFEQIALPWISRRGHLYSLAGPAPIAKRDQTVVMHDATPFRYPSTFRRSFVLWYQVMYRVLARRARRIVTVSEFSRSELADVLGISDQRVALAPCGSDHVPRGERAGVELPFPPHTYALLVGNLAPHKNIAPALTALSTAGIPVAVVGGAQPQVFREAAGLAKDNVRFLGRLEDDELEAVMAAAGVLVAPSRYEGFGIPVVEAGRLGCPSVYAAGSAMSEVAGAGGLAFDPGDMRRCAELVTQVLQTPALRAELAERARENAHRFSWSDSAQAVFRQAGVPDASASGAAVRGDCDPVRRSLRVLHVTESFAAGTGVAITGFARGAGTEGVASFLLAQDRGGGLLDELKERSPFEQATIVAPGLVRLWREIGPAVRAARPDIVHAHSSLAGVVVRLRMLAWRRVPVVYSPHCFAFERRDVSGLRRRLYRTTEAVLARLTAGFVCVSPHEAALARTLAPQVVVRFVANYFEPGPAVRATGVTPGADGTLRLVSVGRISPQKDPAMFAEVVRGLHASGTEVEACWVGDGDDEGARQALVDAGVRITGWLPAGRVPEVLAAHSLYIHTASWEALPIAVMEAMRVGLVVLVRHNEAYTDLLPAGWQFHELPEAVRMVDGFRDPARHRERLEDQDRILAGLRARGPDAVLADAYREVYASWWSTGRRRRRRHELRD